MATERPHHESARQLELERAHAALIVSAGQLQLLNVVSTAANGSTSALELAPQLLGSVCAHFGWRGGWLIRFSDPAAEIAAHYALPGSTSPRSASVIERALLLHAMPPQPVLVDHDHVLVAVPGADRTSWAWLFATTGGAIGAREQDVLTRIGVETARVVEREGTQRRLREGENRFRSVFSASPLPMGLTMGKSGTYGAVNEALCRLVGRTPSELLGRSARDIVHPDDIALTDPAGAAAAAAPDGRHRLELRLLNSSGAVIICMVTLTWLIDENGARNLLAQMEDITAARRAVDTLRRQAEEDAPTGLANRTLLSRTLSEMALLGASCAVLFIDLDGFKLVNDTRGHDVGDEVLREVAVRLRDSVRPGDVIARFGGDEFVVLCRDERGGVDRRIAGIVADRIQAELTMPIRTTGGLVSLTASIGIAIGVVDCDQAQDLVRRADLAMYQAKRLGKDRWQMYDDGLHERAVAHQRTEAALRNALAEDRFVLHYQPIVSLENCAIIGFEALVRLVTEAGELVAPDEFIAVAEQSGLIVSMGTWVLREACRTIAALRQRTGTKYIVSVNIAARQLARVDFVETVLTALATADLPPQALSLELTETALLEANTSTLSQLTQLRDCGIGISLDDFGTGYSSLTYLRTFPVTTLKVDKSFVSGVTSVAGDLAIVRAVTQLAGDLGLQWVVEGVESIEQHRALAALGGGFGQGYLYSRPVAAEHLDALVDAGVSPST